MESLNHVTSVDSASISNNVFMSSLYAFRKNKNIDDEEKNPKTKKFRDVLRDKLNFSSSLPSEEKNVVFEIQKYLEKLQDDVYSTGDALFDTISPENILAYKKAIKAFIDYVLNSTYEIENVVTNSINPARRKAWTIVKVINEKLDKLTAELMYSQLRKIEILQRIDEIKGLIVDLLG